MKQIIEDYCSFEVAKLLKEKGFDERGLCVYTVEEERFYTFGDWVENSCLLPHLISAPTHQMALKWLREVHKLHIYAKPYWPQGDMRNKMSWQGFIVDLNTINGDSQCYADSYEEAIENRIRFALENLI